MRPLLVVNEVLAANVACLADPQRQFDDWVEIYNAGDVPVDPAGMWLSDDADEPAKWRFPAGTGAIAPGGYLIVWADEDTGAAGLHAGFKLSASGERVCLSMPDGRTIIDKLVFGAQTADVSFGRYPDGGQALAFFPKPTPDKSNEGPYQGEVAPLQFSHERGFHDGPFDLTITGGTPDADIIYTLDGRVPRDSRYRIPPGQKYTGPIRIGRTTCVRVVALKAGCKPTPVYTHTYIVGAPAAVRSLPMISLVGDPSTTFYEPSGVMAIVGGTYNGGVWTPSDPGSYNNAMNRNLERPVSAEWLLPDNEERFQIDCGLRVHGSDYIRPRYVRQDGYWSGAGKFSLRLYFRGQYGPDRLEYPLFPESGADEFVSVVLRAGHNDLTNPFIKDELLRRLHKDMGQVAATGTFANLFINGQHKGYYNPTEHVKEGSCQQWFDSDKPWDVMTMSGIRDGDRRSWDAMTGYATGHNLSNPAYYAEMGRKLDIVCFVDYLIIRLWPNDWDWPQNNWSAACERSETGRWKFFVWDAEGTFEQSRDGGHLPRDRFNELNSQNNANGSLYRALRQSDAFRLLFADRLYKHFYNGGALTEGNVRRRFKEMQEVLRGVIPWMDTYIIDTWTPQRQSIFLAACMREGMYTFDGPTFAVNGAAQQGGYMSATDLLNITPSRSGTIHYTLDGTDPSGMQVTAEPASFVAAPTDVPAGPIVFSRPIRLARSTRVKARVRSGNAWSALAEATFAVGPVAQSLRISEIMYHPADPNTEYIELVNIGPEPVNLCEVRFTSGVDFVFPSWWLDPGARCSVVQDVQAFQARYGDELPCVGQYTGRLDNAGERVELRDAAGAAIHAFEFRDDWYDITDGAGFSLTVRDVAAADPNRWGDPGLWRPSAAPGGSPGSDDAGDIAAPGDVIINELLANASGGVSDWIELHNTSDAAVSLGGWYLSDDADDLAKYEIAPDVAIEPHGYMVLTQDAHFGNAADPGCHTPFGLSRDGETLYLHSTTNGVLTGYSDRVEFGPSMPGMTFGRYLLSTGDFDLAPTSKPTPGVVNAPPQTAP